MTELVRIEGDEIVIRVPISAIPDAAAVSFDDAFGYLDHNCRVTDAALAAESIVRALRHESEDGTTLVHEMLDSAVLNAFEEGDEGFDGGAE
jgi:hypothetical protein